VATCLWRLSISSAIRAAALRFLAEICTRYLIVVVFKGFSEADY